MRPRLLPLISQIIHTVLQHVFSQEFDENYGSFLKADYSIDCGTPLHALYEQYAAAMIVVYPVGVNAMCVAAMRHRDATAMSPSA